MDELIGVIKIFAGNFAPKGYMFCDGSILQIQQNPALYSILGTTYGGDGNTTFALPDLRGRFPIGAGQGEGRSTYVQGATGGVEKVTLTTENLAPHTHMVTDTISIEINCNTNTANTDIPENAYMAPATSEVYNDSGWNSKMAASNANINLQTSMVGAGSPVSLMNPYLAINYIICVEGIYPARN